MRARTIDVTPVWSRGGLETPGALRGIYDKPFLAGLWRRAYIGGYTELEYHSFENGVLGVSEGFRMHRTNLFLFTDLSERVRFGSEIEFETEFEGADPERDIEVSVEMGFLDWVLFEELQIRGGAILVPLGRINVNHDGPVRDITDRPLVSTFVIPTTLTEAGVGVHGTIEPSPDLSLGYEVYAVNGFAILDSDGELSAGVDEPERVLREGRSSIGGDINGNLASAPRGRRPAMSSSVCRRSRASLPTSSSGRSAGRGTCRRCGPSRAAPRSTSSGWRRRSSWRGIRTPTRTATATASRKSSRWGTSPPSSSTSPRRRRR